MTDFGMKARIESVLRFEICLLEKGEISGWIRLVSIYIPFDVSELIKADSVLANIGTARKAFLLVVICFSTFLDTFSNSALFSAIPPICQQLGISNSDSVWLQSGYQLTFSALMLMVCNALITRNVSTYDPQSGRLSDLYNPSRSSSPG